MVRVRKSNTMMGAEDRVRLGDAMLLALKMDGRATSHSHKQAASRS